MAYARLDDGFTDHPKIDRLSDGAFRLHVAGIVYSSRLLTDGFVPAASVQRLMPRFKPAYLKELAKAGIWTPSTDDDGWWIHDYLDHNEPREKVLARREASRRRQAHHRERGTESSDRDDTGRYAASSRAASRRDSRRDGPRDSRRESQGVSPATSPLLSSPITESPSVSTGVVSTVEDDGGEDPHRDLWMAWARRDLEAELARGGAVRSKASWLAEAARRRQRAHEAVVRGLVLPILAPADEVIDAVERSIAERASTRRRHESARALGENWAVIAGDTEAEAREAFEAQLKDEPDVAACVDHALQGWRETRRHLKLETKET